MSKKEKANFYFFKIDPDDFDRIEDGLDAVDRFVFEGLAEDNLILETPLGKRVILVPDDRE